jgi:mycobactin lysine-N-oxygenase
MTAELEHTPGPTDLIVVGAGPKATAIAAKVHALNELELGQVSLLIIEEAQSAASWLGANGMTSGEELLAISPLKDVGFPYETERLMGAAGQAIDGLLLEFSWTRYLIEQRRYARWLNAGSPPVRHGEYGRYLAWALARARNGVHVLRGRATELLLEHEPPGWAVEVCHPTGTSWHRGRALVLTGSGVHRPLAHDPEAAPRVLHCDSHRDELERISAGQERDVAIVGGGDGALACLMYLRTLPITPKLTVYSPTPPVSRGESFLENRVFSDPDSVSWSSLDLATRRAFIRHTDQGVFDPQMLSQIALEDRCTFVVGRVTHVAAAAQAVSVEYDAPDGPARARHDYVVNCTGFDLLGQVGRLFPQPTRALIEAQAGPVWDGRSGHELAFGPMLELEGLRPKLHMPGLAALSQGPGFANLGCLGLTSNRVLQPFLCQRAGVGREMQAA